MIRYTLSSCGTRVTRGWAALNTGDREATVTVPAGMIDAKGVSVPATVKLAGHRGLVLRRR